MFTPKRILIATDFSDGARAALDSGRLLAQTFKASLHVLHVVTEPLNEPWTGFGPAAALMETVEQARCVAHARLDTLVADDDAVVVATAWGDPAGQILEYAERHAIDLIVCGTHGRRGWDRFVMGSVAERVVRLASCPVMTVPMATDAALAA